MSGTAPYYTQAFSPLPGRCFRLVSGGEGGGPTHCPEPPVWRGPFRIPNGRRYRVEARFPVSAPIYAGRSRRAAARSGNTLATLAVR